MTESLSAVEAALALSASRHERLCPRQVLGVRIGLAGAASLHMEIPTRDHRLLVFVETDGCFADGVEAATGCSLGHRTMRLEDYGRVAATFVRVADGRAVRIAPAPGIRELAAKYAAHEPRRYYAQMHAYQHMPANELLTVQDVRLKYDIATLIGRNGSRVNCVRCGEEVINQRESVGPRGAVCRACRGDSYYRELGAPGLPPATERASSA